MKMNRFILYLMVLATALGQDLMVTPDEDYVMKPLTLERVTQKTFFDIAIDGKKVGRVVFGLFGDACPKTVKNFYELSLGSYFKKARKGNIFHAEVKPGTRVSYTGNHFHRIIPGFMAQAGDLDYEDGRGSRSIYGKKFDDENLTLKFSKPYLLAMANSGPDTNGSQFFITFKADEKLDGHHVIFGEVLEGFEVLKQIEQAGTDDGTPSKKVKITWSGIVHH